MSTVTPSFIVLGILGGFIGSLLPNDKSNIPRWILAVIFGVLAVKIVYGDFEEGFHWSKSDLIFYPFTILLGIIGHYICYYIGKDFGNTFKHLVGK